jgi:bifunctional non-homologous end joining protein LigD
VSEAAVTDVALSSLDRVLWPRSGFTKGDLVEYYREIASVLLPHIRGRPLTLGRWPQGVDQRGFAQTECRGRPDWMATHALTVRSGEVRHFCVVNDLRSLLWVANLGTIELHSFLGRGERIEEPTAVVFDLDPGRGADLADCCAAALRLREALRRSRLEAFVKTSGAAGLHVFVPLNMPHTFAQTKTFARALARRLAEEDPDRVTDVQARGQREGKVLLDWLQNEPRRSLAVPYSLRAMPWPTVSTPVSWDEVDRAENLVFTPAEVRERVRKMGDLFQPVLELEQALPATGCSR